MSDTRYEDRKQLLEAWRQELQRSLTDKLASVRANTGHETGRPETLDAADASETDLQLDVSVSLTEMTAEALRRIDAALARIASGDYGVCAECGADIPTNRLAALPFAVRCRDCEEWREVNVRHARRVSAEPRVFRV
jgi:DnaK suppressor protein